MKDKNKIIVLISGVIVILLMVFGVSFAIFRFGNVSTNQELVLGDIWMKYTESNGISLENSLPGDEYTNYFEFTITGTNTYTKKDIWYDISLTHGDIPAGKEESNRVEDKYLKFKLTEVNGSTESEIFTDKTYDDLTNKRVHVDTISKSTSTYSKTYRLYMVISEELTYGNSSDAILTTEEFGKIFGSVKVNVTGDFNEKEVDTPVYLKDVFKEELLTRTNSYILEDDIYYVSGAKDDNNSETKDDIDFNYVWYSGKLWRITAINPDGTLKMITEDNITTLNWGATSTVSSEDLTSAYSTSYMREWLNQEFLPTLYNYENIIVEDAGWYSITDSSASSTKPTGDYTLTDPVGLLNAYEYYMTYKNVSTSTNYLNIDYEWWLITPYDSKYVFHVTDEGGGDKMYPTPSGRITNGFSGVRPSINLKSTIIVNGGSGTTEDPYTITSDVREVIANKTLLNTRNSGEYIKIESDITEQIFRIVEKELLDQKLTTKLVLNDYVKESGSILNKKFTSSSDNLLWNSISEIDQTYWRGYLNTTWLAMFDTNMLEKGIYYLGNYTNGSYKTTVCSTVSSEISIKDCIDKGTVVSDVSRGDYVGLLRVGEMFSNQTNDYTSLTASNMFLITVDIEESTIRGVVSGGYLGAFYVSNPYPVRPTINLTSTVVIKSGSGTETDPFVVGLPEDSSDEGQ